MGTFTSTASAAHAVPTAPELSNALNDGGDDYTQPVDNAPAPPRRNFRGGGQMGGLATPYVSSISDPATNRAAEHAGRGAADPRRGFSLTTPSADTAPAPERYVNERDIEPIDQAPAPSRMRQGFTGADPARVSMQQRAYLIRPFDKFARAHPGRVTHGDQPAPRAATPPVYGELAGGLPGAMGRTGTRAAGIGTHPNTFRLLPKPWDALALNTGGPAVSSGNPDPAQAAASVERARSWRL